MLNSVSKALPEEGITWIFPFWGGVFTGIRYVVEPRFVLLVADKKIDISDLVIV